MRRGTASDDSTGTDVLVLGGGAKRSGVAVDSAASGYATLLVEARDFAQGTNSRRAKLVHGGVRYLHQGNVGLVPEALRERGNLLRNAPHLAYALRLLVPAYRWWHKPFHGIGLALYDLLAGRLGFHRARLVDAATARHLLPTLAAAKRTLGRKLPRSRRHRRWRARIGDRGIATVIISLGARGRSSQRARTWLAAAPPVERRSTVGADGSVVAGPAVALANGHDIVEGLRHGTVAGAATAMTPGKAQGTAGATRALVSQVRIADLP